VKVNPYAIAILFLYCFLYTSCKKDNPGFKARLTEVLHVDSQWKMALKYNSDGKLVSTLQFGGDSLFYDNQGRIIKYNNSYVTYAFEYSPNGQIKRRIPVATVLRDYHPDTLDYIYDAKGRIVECNSTFNDASGVSHQGWSRYYKYNSQNDIIDYNTINLYYNQAGGARLSYDNGANPLNFSNSLLFFLNEELYAALNQHNPIRKYVEGFISIYSYDYADTRPLRQTIKFYPPGQPVEPLGYRSLSQVKYKYE